MTECAHQDDWLLDLLDGELPPARAAEIEEHLAICAECRRAVDDYRAIIDSYRSAPPEEPPEEETSRIIRSAAVARARGRRGTWLGLAAAAALLLAGGAVGGWLLRDASRAGTEPAGTASDRMAEEATRREQEMLRALAEMQRELKRTRAEQAAAAGDAGVTAAKAKVRAVKAATGDADEISGGATKVDGPGGGSGGLAAPRWKAKKKLSDDPLSGDLGL